MKGALGAAWPIAPPQTAGKLKKSYKDFDEDAEEGEAGPLGMGGWAAGPVSRAGR